jgi:hypothetical protein
LKAHEPLLWSIVDVTLEPSQALILGLDCGAS